MKAVAQEVMQRNKTTMHGRMRRRKKRGKKAALINRTWTERGERVQKGWESYRRDLMP